MNRHDCKIKGFRSRKAGDRDKKRHLIGKYSNHLSQLGRYVIVGIIAFCFDYLTLVVLTELAGFHYLTSATVGFLVGLIVNYFLSIQFVFKASKLSDKRVEFTVFATIGVGGLLINNGLMWFLTDFFLLHYTASKIAAVGVVFLWNFYVRKLALFNG